MAIDEFTLVVYRLLIFVEVVLVLLCGLVSSWTPWALSFTGLVDTISYVFTILRPSGFNIIAQSRHRRMTSNLTALKV